MNDRTYRLPKSVYYQCMWIVKDMDRLRRLEVAADSGGRCDEFVFFEVDEEVVTDREVLREAKFKLDCIRKALEKLPEEYRQGTLDRIIYNLPFTEVAHENTWRKWRKVFIQNLAVNLRLV